MVLKNTRGPCILDEEVGMRRMKGVRLLLLPLPPLTRRRRRCC